MYNRERKSFFFWFLLFVLLGIFHMNQHEVTSQGNVWLLNIEGAPIAPEDHCTVAGKEDIISGCDETESNLPRAADS